MSVLEEHNSLTLNEYPRSSSIAQRFYLNSTNLSSAPSKSNSDSSGTEVTTPAIGEDAGPANLIAPQAELVQYESESGKKLANSNQPVPYFGQPILNVSVPTVLNTLNSNFPNVVSTSSQAIPSANPINYYDPFTSRPQAAPMQSVAYYPSQEYSKYPPLHGPSSANMSCVHPYSANHVECTNQGQPVFQANASARAMDQPYMSVYPQPPIDSARLGCNSTVLDLNARHSDSLTRQGRNGFPMYPLNGSEDPLGSHLPPQSTRLGGNGVELLISNLDYNIGAKEWRKILFTQLQSTIKNVHSVVIQTQADGSNCAIIKVGTIEDARLAISHFHRKKIGYKRIQVNIVSPNGSFGTKGLKGEVVSLLRSVSSNALPVCKFIDLFEKRYHRSISVADLYKMRDVIEIKEQPGSQGGRLITLSVRAQRYDGVETSPATDLVFCRRHCVEGSPEYLQAMDCSMLPSVQVSLNVFRQQVLQLLRDHGGSMPLLSFPACYKAEFGELTTVPSNSNQTTTTTTGHLTETGTPQKLPVGNPYPPAATEVTTTATQPDSANAQSAALSTSASSEVDSAPDRTNVPVGETTSTTAVTGVPLEHLLTCVPSVRIHVEQNGLRKLVFEPGSDQTQTASNVVGPNQSFTNSEPFYTKCPLNDPLAATSPAGNQPGLSMNPAGPPTSTSAVLLDQLHQFSREVVDLLKHQPGCQILLSKFIPSYHHHFGKQCRVADYGYSKLHELIDALPSVVHVMGSGHVRLLTLSHRVQVRRFTNELIKVLKSQSTKSCRLTDYAAIYRRIYRKDFRITDYGVCYLFDMLMEVSDSAVEITQVGSDTLISLPKRVQTTEERERTELFAIEVADLLCQSPRCRLPFNKFIPSYHHHFSRQCRVADYGFTKLIDLLEAVPNVVQIVEEHGEKYVTLVGHRHLRIVAEQLLAMLEAAPGKRIPLDDLLNVYMKHQGYALCLEDFQFSSVRELLSKLPRLVRIETVSVEQPSSHVPLTSSDGDSANTSVSPNALSTDKKSALPGEEDESNNQDGNVATSVAHPNETPGDSGPVTEFKEPVNLVRPTVDYVCLADRAQIKHLAHKVLLVLLEAPSGTLSVTQFSERFRCTFRDEPNLNLIYEELGDIVEFKKHPANTASDSSVLSTSGSSAWNDKGPSDSVMLLNPHTISPGSASREPDMPVTTNEAMLNSPASAQIASTAKFSTPAAFHSTLPNWEVTSYVISLRPLIMFARELRELLRQNQGKLLLVQLCAVYQRRFGVPLRPQRYNYPSLATLLQAVDFVAVMRGRGVRCTLVLCQDFLGKLSYRVAYNTKPVLGPVTNTSTNKEVDEKEISSGELTQTKPIDSVHTYNTLASWNQSLMNSSYSGLIPTSDNVPSLSNLFHTNSQSNLSRPSNAPNMSSLLATPNHTNTSAGSMQPFTSPYFTTHTIAPCNLVNSYVTSGQLDTNAFNYYSLPTRTSQTTTTTQPAAPPPAPPQAHQFFPNRPTYPNSVLMDSPASFPFIPGNVDYGSTIPSTAQPHQTDYTATPYTSVVYHSQPASCAPITVVPSPGQSNPCFVGPGGETANGSIPFHTPVYSASTLYPFTSSLGYPQVAASVPCSQQPNATIDSRNSVGSENSATGSLNGLARSMATGSYVASDKLPCYPTPALPGTNAVNLSQFGLTPAAQQQLDELVERLAYDNRTDGSMGKPTGNAVGCTASNRATGQFAPLAYRNSLPTVAPQLPYPTGFASRTVDNAVASSYPASMLSTYWASQGTSPGGFSGTPLSSSQFPNSSSLVNLHKQLGDTAVLNVQTSTAKDSTETPNVSDETKPLDQPFNGLDPCKPVKQIMPNMVGVDTTSCEKEASIGTALNALDHGDPNSRYTLLGPDSNSYQLERCSNKPSIVFPNSVPSGESVRSINPMMIPKQVSLMPNLGLLDQTQIGPTNISSNQPKKINGSILDSECNGVRGCGSQLNTFDVALSPEDAGTSFSFDGLLAELRLEEKQQEQQRKQEQQQQQEQQRQKPQQGCDNSEHDLKQNTRMILDNFSYL